MKYIYEFADEEKTTCEVTEELAAVLAEMDRAEKTNEHSYRIHTYSLEETDYEGEAFGAWDEYDFGEPDPVAEHVHAAFATLTDVQKRRLLLYAAGKTYREIARIEGVDHKKIIKSIDLSRKKFQKFF